MDDLILPVDAFMRSIGVNRSAPHALFLGAGASITSGVPSASMCIWEWKRDIFLTNNPGMEDQFSELSLPTHRTRPSCVENGAEGLNSNCQPLRHGAAWPLTLLPLRTRVWPILPHKIRCGSISTS
jgi:hypothetical protein